MCYSLYLSTDSNADLAQYNTELLRFAPLDDFTYADLLAYPNKWYVGSKAGCSCTFRHAQDSMDFGEPVNWYEEEPDALDATKELYAVLAKLISAGHRVDCVNTWEGVCPTQIESMDVSLAGVKPEAFRLFENYRFVFR